MLKYLCALVTFMSAALPVCSEELPPPNTVAAKSSTESKTSVEMRLSDVKTIFVAPLGTDEGAELVRQKVINKLIRDKLFTVVESPSSADAVLMGASGVNHRHHLIVTNSFISTGTRYSAECVVRLVGKNQQVLWMNETSTRRLFGPHSARAASSTVADKLVDELSKAIELERSQIAAK